MNNVDITVRTMARISFIAAVALATTASGSERGLHSHPGRPSHVTWSDERASFDLSQLEPRAPRAPASSSSVPSSAPTGSACGRPVPPTPACSLPFLYVAQATAASVAVVDPATLTELTTIPVGLEPRGMALSPDGSRLYVANRDSNDLTVVDTVTSSPIAFVPTGTDPNYIDVSPDHAKIYVTNRAEGTVSVIDATTLLETATIPVGSLPIDLLLDVSGETLYVANLGGRSVSVVDTCNEVVVAQIAVAGNAGKLALSPDGARLYVTLGSGDAVDVIDTATRSVFASVPFGHFTTDIVVSRDGLKAWVTVSEGGPVSYAKVLDTATLAVLPGLIDSGGNDLSLSTDGTVLYALRGFASQLYLIDTATDTIVDQLTVTGFPWTSVLQDECAAPLRPALDRRPPHGTPGLQPGM